MSTMSNDELLAVIARHRDAHQSLSFGDAYSAQEAPRLSGAYDAVIALIAERDALLARNAELMQEHNEDQGVIAVWRGRFYRSEDEVERLKGRVKILEGKAS